MKRSFGRTQARSLTRARAGSRSRVANMRAGALAAALGLGTVLAVGGPLAGGGAASAAGSKPTITLYSGQHEQTTQTLVNGFEKKTGITVKIRSDDEDVLADQMVTEGSRSPADVFFTENSPPLQFLASKGLLAPIAPSTLAKTPSRFNSPQGKWVGVSARVSVLVYNTDLLKASQLPTSAMDAGQPEVEGQARHRRRGDRLPAHRHLHRARPRHGGRTRLAQGGQGQRRQQPFLPGQRDADR